VIKLIDKQCICLDLTLKKLVVEYINGCIEVSSELSRCC
jgi:hypothetical protein